MLLDETSAIKHYHRMPAQTKTRTENKISTEPIFSPYPKSGPTHQIGPAHPPTLNPSHYERVLRASATDDSITCPPGPLADDPPTSLHVCVCTWRIYMRHVCLPGLKQSCPRTANIYTNSVVHTVLYVVLYVSAGACIQTYVLQR